MTTLPKIYETTFGGYLATIYGYASREEINPEDSDVLDMVSWTMDDPAGPRIGWDERIFYWENADGFEQIWRHSPTAEDLDAYGDLRPSAVGRRGR